MIVTGNSWLHAVFGVLIGIAIHAWWSWRDIAVNFKLGLLLMIPAMLAASQFGKRVAAFVAAILVVWYAWRDLSDRDSGSSLVVIAVVCGVAGFFWGEDFLKSAMHFAPRSIRQL